MTTPLTDRLQELAAIPPLPEPRAQSFTPGFTAEQMRDYAMAALAAKTEQEPDGWQLVPKEPTAEMIWAAEREQTRRWLADRERQRVQFEHALYRAMLAAAPKAPTDADVPEQEPRDD